MSSLTMKSNCKGCRALKWNHSGHTCKLDYEIDTIHYLDGSLEIFPLEPCYKPLTFDAYFKIIQSRENAARLHNLKKERTK